MRTLTVAAAALLSVVSLQADLSAQVREPRTPVSTPAKTTARTTAEPQRRPQPVSLGKVIPEVKFDNVSLTDALDMVRDLSDSNLHVNWKALEGLGVSRDMPVSLNLRNVSLRMVLTLILHETGSASEVTFYIDEGIIEITSKELADQKMFTRIYPIDDLIMEIPDFDNPPEFNLDSTQNQNQGGGGQGGGGGSSSGGGQGVFGSQGGGGGQGGSGGSRSPSRTKEERAQDIIELITETISPDIWRENGGTASIRFYNGSLIVTAPRSVLERIGG